MSEASHVAEGARVFVRSGAAGNPNFLGCLKSQSAVALYHLLLAAQAGLVVDASLKADCWK